MAALGTRALTVTIAATDYTAQVSECVITSQEADADFTTFADAAAGGAREYRLKFKMVQDLVASTLWDRIWASAGTTVAYVVKPYGNATASATQPHYSGNLVITEPDGDFIGGAADASSSARFTTEVEWVLTAKPTKVIV